MKQEQRAEIQAGLKALPPKRDRRELGQDRFTVQLPLKTITPIMSGGAVSRRVSREQPIRVASVRGQLRLWWRALIGHTFANANDLRAAEAKLWGGATGREAMLASAVSISISYNKTTSQVIQTDVTWQDPDFYITWPAQSFGGANPSERWREGLEFDITLSGPKASKALLEDTLKAWLLFGGYGGRARRGMGAITVRDPAKARQWLPATADLPTLSAHFTSCPDWLTHTAPNPHETPSLRGAGLAIEPLSKPNAMNQWMKAISWMKDFRQGSPPNGRAVEGPDAAKYARVGSPDPRRPSISNWPEADKIRRVFSAQGPFTHTPRHNDRIIWPRASFGLPIQVQFQKMDRHKNRNAYREPNNVMINLQGEQQNRLASPLIIKPMAVGDGAQFVPCALWLNRAFPSDDLAPALTTETRRSKGSWDELIAPGDTALFRPLSVGQRAPRGKRLRTAFFEWLREHPAQNITLLNP